MKTNAPIRSEQDLDVAIAVLNCLLSRNKPLDQEEQDYLESLSHEIERYEAAAHPMPAVSDAAMLRHLVEAKDVTLSQVAETVGITLSTLSSVANGKRRLTRGHIQQLAPYFGVEPGVFLRWKAYTARHDYSALSATQRVGKSP